MPTEEKGQKIDIVITGELKEGFAQPDVISSLAELFKLPRERAEKLITSAPRVLKSAGDIKTVNKYVAALERIGLVTLTEERTASIASPSAQAMAPQVANEQQSAFNRSNSPAGGPAGPRFCQSCGHPISGSPRFCENCGAELGHASSGTDSVYKDAELSSGSPNNTKAVTSGLSIVAGGLIFLFFTFGNPFSASSRIANTQFEACPDVISFSQCRLLDNGFQIDCVASNSAQVMVKLGDWMVWSYDDSGVPAGSMNFSYERVPPGGSVHVQIKPGTLGSTQLYPRAILCTSDPAYGYWQQVDKIRLPVAG